VKLGKLKSEMGEIGNLGERGLRGLPSWGRGLGMMTDIEKRLLKILTANSDQLAAIDRILEGKTASVPEPPKGPLLMMIKDAAELLGVHRTTVWRLMRAGRLEEVELLGSVRVRRTDVEALAAGMGA
jgi:excisionase family DNA binding protein